ncbi:hypothetical protein KKF75_03195, partial [Patescibacteria group bacterium]|nr:hypothetical protein [Patescibacteria group bacterium]
IVPYYFLFYLLPIMNIAPAFPRPHRLTAQLWRARHFAIVPYYFLFYLLPIMNIAPAFPRPHRLTAQLWRARHFAIVPINKFVSTK